MAIRCCATCLGSCWVCTALTTFLLPTSLWFLLVKGIRLLLLLVLEVAALLTMLLVLLMLLQVWLLLRHRLTFIVC